MFFDKKKINKPMMGSEMIEWIPRATLLRQYDLMNYRELPQLPIIILYEIKKDFGHWVIVLRTSEGIEHFDSYGFKPDEELSFIPPEYKKASGQDKQHLLKLLYESGENIHYNDYVFQGAPPTATCGRWCIFRFMFSYLNIDQFAEMIKKTIKQSGLNSDEITASII